MAAATALRGQSRALPEIANSPALRYMSIVVPMQTRSISSKGDSKGDSMEKPVGAIRKPRTDDRRIWDIFLAARGYQAVLVAHELGLFRLLAERPRALAEICQVLRIARRPAEALLAIVSSLGLARLDGDGYSITELAEDYLLEESPTYFGRVFDLAIANPALYSVEALKNAILTDSPQAYGGNDIWQSHQKRAERAQAFTLAMHSTSMGPALAWPEMVDLGAYRTMLDVGGGSGAHSIGAASAWPNLRPVVFDLAPVCEMAKRLAARYGLEGRIETHPGDMWCDPFPPAEVHFYSMIFHDWPEQRCRALTRKSFESLAAGGRIIIHEMLFDDDRSGPLAVAAENIATLLWVPGQQHSGRELRAMLSQGGFIDIEVKPTFGYWSIVTGRKP